MRTTLITLMLAMASAVAAAQGGSWFDDFAAFWGYAPIEEVREREAAVDEREAAVEKHAARFRTREMAVGRREAAISQREKDATLKMVRDVGAGVILGGVLLWCLLWWFQNSKVGRLKQRCRNAEQSLASMRDERDQAQTRFRKTAADLTKAQQKHASIRKARDEAEAKCREAESTIHRLRDRLEDAERKAREADGSRSTQQRTARQILGVAVGASRDDVKAAHKRVANTVHPDRCTGSEANRLMQLANDARNQLLGAA